MTSRARGHFPCRGRMCMCVCVCMRAPRFSPTENLSLFFPVRSSALSLPLLLSSSRAARVRKHGDVSVQFYTRRTLLPERWSLSQQIRASHSTEPAILAGIHIPAAPRHATVMPGYSASSVSGSSSSGFPSNSPEPRYQNHAPIR